MNIKLSLLLFILIHFTSCVQTEDTFKGGVNFFGRFLMDTGTIVGNPLDRTHQFLDKNNNSTIRFDEAYGQTLNMKWAVDKEAIDELSLVDYDDNGIISEEEFKLFQKRRDQILIEQDGELSCTNEELIKDFAHITKNRYYRDTIWPGKLVSKLYESKCLTSSYNQLLMRALEAIDANSDNAIDNNEFYALYGDFISKGGSFHKHRFNLWNMNHEGELKLTITFGESYIALPGTDLFSWDIRSNRVRKWISESNYEMPISQFYDHFKHLQSYYLPGRNNSKYMKIHNYKIEEFPELARFDLNKDGVYNFIDKLGIDYTIHLLFLNKTADCRYTSFLSSIMSVDRVCEKRIPYLNRDFFTLEYNPDEALFSYNQIEEDFEEKLKVPRYLMAYTKKLIPNLLNERIGRHGHHIELLDPNSLILRHIDPSINLYHMSRRYSDPDGVYSPIPLLYTLMYIQKETERSLNFESAENLQRYKSLKNELINEIMKDPALLDHLSKANLNEASLKRILEGDFNDLEMRSFADF